MDSLLLEIGTEEIPAGYINPALEALSATLLQKMTAARIEHGAAKVFGTPRKLAVKVENVAVKQKSIKTEVIGPPTKIGLDEKGNQTVAARKFAQKVNLAVNKLSIKDTAKGSYRCGEKTEKGQATRNMLKNILPEAILSIPFPKKMRWADLNIEFARPIFSILALLGKAVIPFQLGNIKSGRYTHGHYFMSPGRINVTDADDYVDALRNAYVLVDIDERRQKLKQDINKVARKLGGRILPDEDLVDINTNLVEYPIAVSATCLASIISACLLRAARPSCSDPTFFQYVSSCWRSSIRLLSEL